MLKILSTLLSSLLLLSAAGAQDIHQVKKFSDDQFIKGNYQLALKESQRVIFFDTENEYNELYSRIASIYYRMSDFDLARKYFEFASRVEKNDSLRYEMGFKRALCNFNLNNYLAALTDLFDMEGHPSEFLKVKTNLYFGICYFGLNDLKTSYVYFSELLDSTGLANLDKLFHEFERFNNKFRPEKVELMSKLLPGLGQLYTGEILSGINSVLLLTGVTFYAMVTAVNYAFFDGLLVLSSWFYRYYSGGYTNASQYAVKKIEMEKVKVYSEVFSIIEKYQNKSLE